MVEIGQDTTFAVFSADTAVTTVKATEKQCKTETNVFEFSADGGKPPMRLWKTDAEQGGSQKPRSPRVGIKPTTIGTPLAWCALANVKERQATRPPKQEHAKLFYFPRRVSENDIPYTKLHK